MPDFATAFTPKASERMLNRNELIRAIRLLVADEYEAIQVYTQLAESIEDEFAKEILLDIADEERVHAGEFLRLLFILAPEEEQFYRKGAQEVEAAVAAHGKEKPQKQGNETTIGSIKD